MFSFNNRHFFDFMGSEFHKLQVGRMFFFSLLKRFELVVFWLEYFSNRDDKLNYLKAAIHRSLTKVG